MGARPVLTQGRLLLGWEMTAHLTHREGAPLSEEQKKPAPLSAAFIIQSFPQPQGLLWGCGRSTSQGHLCLLCPGCGQQTQGRGPKRSRSHVWNPGSPEVRVM